MKARQEVYAAEERRLKEEEEEAAAALRRVEERMEAHQNFTDVVQRLLSSWKDADPGKYSSVYFFVGQASDSWVVIREFLPEGTPVCIDREEWRRYVNSRSWRNLPYDRVRPSLPVVLLVEVKTESCPHCGKARPVIEHYAQTCDSAEGDNWLTERLVLCTDCKVVLLVAEPENSSMRMR